MWRPLGHPVERLADDPHGLAHLLDAHRVAVVGVAVGPERHLEVEVLVARVGRRLAQVEVHAGGAQRGAGHAEVDQLLGREHADALGAVEPDRVARQQALVLVDAARHLVEEGAQALLEPGGHVVGAAAHLEVPRVHAVAGDHLAQVEGLLALAVGVEEQRDGAELQAAGAQPDQVARDAVELGHDHAQVLGAVGDLELQQALHRHRVGVDVEERGQVVHPRDERDALPVGLVLALLLDAGVQVADHRVQVADDLAVELGDQAQHAVGRGVLGAEVDDHRAGASPGSDS